MQIPPLFVLAYRGHKREFNGSGPVAITIFPQTAAPLDLRPQEVEEPIRALGAGSGYAGIPVPDQRLEGGYAELLTA